MGDKITRGDIYPLAASFVVGRLPTALKYINIGIGEQEDYFRLTTALNKTFGEAITLGEGSAFAKKYDAIEAIFSELLDRHLDIV
tara:strand:- start:715 stop:969 length:255 start_codon:yes stop_codon:yes gene_type:complete